MYCLTFYWEQKALSYGREEKAFVKISIYFGQYGKEY
jgi:hypothetical protein